MAQAAFKIYPLLTGAAVGAYGMNRASTSSWGDLWSYIPKNWETPGSTTTGAGGTTDVTALRGELSRLASLVSDLSRSGSGRPTVVQLGGRNGWTVLVVPAVAGGACLYLYCKVTGTGLADLLFVSRSSMAAFRNTVQEGLSNMWGEMRRQKDEFMKMVTTLGQKQDTLHGNQEQLMEQQQKMDEVLKRVDGNVDGLDAKADNTISHVNQIDGRLQDVHVGVQAANQGIYMLMSVVSEVTSKIGLHNSRASQSLHRYLQGGPAWGNSITNTSTSSSVGSSIDASGAAASGSSRALSPSNAKLPLPSLSNPNGCEMTVDGEGGRGGGADHRRSSSSLGGMRDILRAGGESMSRFSSFNSSTFGGSGNLLGGGKQKEGGDASDRSRAASEGMPKGYTGMPPDVLDARGRMTNMSIH